VLVWGWGTNREGHLINLCKRGLNRERLIEGRGINKVFTNMWLELKFKARKK
jgi:hypothetical protein